MVRSPAGPARRAVAPSAHSTGAVSDDETAQQRSLPGARVAAHAGELADAAQADQRFRLELATLHVGKQIRAAGNEHGVRAAVGEIPDGIIDRARRHVIERGKPNHCNECREAGPGRGWPDIEGWWLRSIECREAGSGRGWPAIEGWWLRSNGCREAGPGRGWPDIEGWWLRSIECREAGSGRGWPAIEGR